jgi:cytochrome c5
MPSIRISSMTTISAIAVVALLGGGALAQERRIDLKPGPGLQTFQSQCATCHSLDYVVLNSPFLDRAGWDAEVKKMVNAFGAPISAEDQKIIIDYLAASYAKP